MGVELGACPNAGLDLDFQYLCLGPWKIQACPCDLSAPGPHVPSLVPPLHAA